MDSCLFVTLVYEANSYNSELSSYFIMLPMRRVQHGRFWACALSNVLELSKWSVVGCLNGIRSQDRCVNSKTSYTCSPVRERKVPWQCVVLWNVLFRQQGRGRLLLAAVRLPPSSPELWAAREAHLQLQLIQAPIAGALDLLLNSNSFACVSLDHCRTY